MGLLERLGFVRLRDFGLILTADRRIVTTREVLDDGFGNTIVGWEDSDLAAVELKKRRAPTSPSAANVTFRPLPPPPPPVPTKLGVVKQSTAPMQAQAPAPKLPPPAAPKPSPVPFLSNTVAYPVSNPALPNDTEIVSVCVTHVPSGDDDFVKEDEWDWQIARARAMPEDTTPEPPKTAAVNPFAKEPRRAAVHPAQVAVAVAGAPRTIIPVPSLPAAVDPRRILEAYHPPLPRRMPRGTRPMANEDDTSTALRAIPGRR